MARRTLNSAALSVASSDGVLLCLRVNNSSSNIVRRSTCLIGFSRQLVAPAFIVLMVAAISWCSTSTRTEGGGNARFDALRMTSVWSRLSPTSIINRECPRLLSLRRRSLHAVRAGSEPLSGSTKSCNISGTASRGAARNAWPLFFSFTETSLCNDVWTAQLGALTCCRLSFCNSCAGAVPLH